MRNCKSSFIFNQSEALPAEEEKAGNGNWHAQNINRMF